MGGDGLTGNIYLLVDMYIRAHCNKSTRTFTEIMQFDKCVEGHKRPLRTNHHRSSSMSMPFNEVCFVQQRTASFRQHPEQ